MSQILLLLREPVKISPGLHENTTETLAHLDNAYNCINTLLLLFLLF